MKRRTLELAGIIRRYETLTEGDDTTDDLFGGGDEDDTGDDDAEADDTGDTDEAGDEGEEGEEEDEEEPIESLTPDEIAKYGPGEIEKVVDEKLEGFFMSSQKSAAVRQSVSAGYPGHADESDEPEGKEDEDTVVESRMIHRSSLASLLLEEEEVDQAVQAEVDMVAFASDVHNLMSNYDNLLDMEGMIFTKARQYLINQLGEEAADEMEELLALRHGWDPEEKYDISGSQNTMVAPPAAGAMTGGAPAA